MQSLDDLLSHHSLVTFRYYAQHAGLPVTDAKEALREYADSHKGEVHVVHLLGGQRKTESGDGPLEYKLVPEEQLEETKELFEPLTACHPYSIHAKKAESGEKLFLLNHGQDRDLYDELRATSSSNCLLDNRWAAVKCSAATLRPKKAPKKAPAAPPPPPPKAAASSSASSALAAKAFGSSSSPSASKPKEAAAKPTKEAAKPAAPSKLGAALSKNSAKVEVEPAEAKPAMSMAELRKMAEPFHHSCNCTAPR